MKTFYYIVKDHNGSFKTKAIEIELGADVSKQIGELDEKMSNAYPFVKRVNSGDYYKAVEYLRFFNNLFIGD